ncbi:hypothetical protein FAES_4470 [Fibrella aestuarina BUZ 2]|uniref:Uncharacterized protein n=1 Tax=Fibrella aestuarina BUZ 2 TaxID=1166018 RepID=I0KEB6_9BACT|nr:hypothetical protein [Fibrella aestuarina]CCH02469.1 hypothetical protein FAES_4470 [Fibrella aestuarina BUZ 2]
MQHQTSPSILRHGFGLLLACAVMPRPLTKPAFVESIQLPDSAIKAEAPPPH